MVRFGRIPLARKNLTHDYWRLAVAVGGIGFAVMLMFMQMGFRNALFDSTVKVIDELNADLIIVNRSQFALPAPQRFSIQRLVQARECPGVSGAYPLYVEGFLSTLRRPRQKAYAIRVLAFEVNDPVFRSTAIRQAMPRLKPPNTALIDSHSKPKYGIPVHDPERLSKQSIELSGRRVQFVGLFEMGADFANDGNVIMSAQNFARYFPYRGRGADPLSIVDLGIVRLTPHADVQEVQQHLENLLPDDVRVFTKQGFRQAEMGFWRTSTPIGYIFGVGLALGFVVGVIICYQIIFTSVSAHMPEFATLKAMGYRDRYFIALVVCESLYLSILGFIPGLLASWGLYTLLARWTGLLMILTLPRASLVYGFTLAMCMTSGCLAMRKVLSADPAELF